MSLEQEFVRVWCVEGPGLHEDADYVLYDSAEEAGEAAAEAAEYAWDGSIEDPGDALKPGPAVRITCYEMPREEWEAVCAAEEDE